MSNKILTMVNNFLCSPEIRMGYLSKIGFYKHMSDEDYIQKKAQVRLRKRFDLSNPVTMCEKLNWLKIHDRKPIYTTMVDKYKVKEFVGERIGEEHVISTLAKWDRAEDINIDALPNQFVLKCNHDSGSIIVCKDKAKFDLEKAKKKLGESLRVNYYDLSREWPYKNIEKCIIAEPYMDALGKLDSIEYKITCCNGEVKFVTICQGIAHSSFDVRTNDHFTVDFQHMDWYVNYKPAKIRPSKPKQWEEMIDYATKLSSGIPYVRVDFYVIDDVVYFGEFTFFTWGGFMQFVPENMDKELGKLIDLPNN